MCVIRKATYEELPQVAKIYHRILEQEEKGLTTTGWVRGVYPTEETAREAIAAKELFILLEDGVVAAAAKINKEQVPEYRDAQWKYTEVTEEQVMVLHTLVVDPGFAGKGLGTQFVKFYEEYAKEQGCCCLRMDTNARNTAARRLYQHLGFREAGIVDCTFNGISGVKLVCLEKMLKEKI